MQPPDSQQKFITTMKILAISLLIIFAAWVGYTIYHAATFHIVSTSPTTDQFPATSPFFKVTFNKSLSNQGVALSAPSGIIKSNSVSGNTLTIYLSYPLKLNTQYTITIVSIESQSGSFIKNKSFTFTTQNISFNDMPGDAQKYLVKNQDHYTQQQKDPILEFLPYSTLDFSLNTSFPTGADGQPHLVLQAQLLLAPGVTGTEEASDIAKYRQEVLNYIRSQNLDPSKYNIQYQIVHEQLTGV